MKGNKRNRNRVIDRVIAFLLALAMSMTMTAGSVPISASSEMPEAGIAPIINDSPDNLEQTGMPQQQALEAGNTISLKGTVRLAGVEDGEPLAEPSVMAGKTMDFCLEKKDSAETVYWYSITTGQDGGFSILPDLTGVEDGSYLVKLSADGFVFQGEAGVFPEVTITDGVFAAEPEASEIALGDFSLYVAKPACTPGDGETAVWTAAKPQSYTIASFSSEFAYTVQVDGEHRDFVSVSGPSDGILTVTPQNTDASGAVITVTASYGNVSAVSEITVDTVSMSTPGVTMAVSPLTSKRKVTEQRLTVSVTGISEAVLPGTVKLSCQESIPDAEPGSPDKKDSEQGSFWIVEKTGGQEKLVSYEEYKETGVPLSRFAESGSFDCIYKAVGVYQNYGFKGDLIFGASYSGEEKKYTAANTEAKQASYDFVDPIYFTIEDQQVMGGTNQVSVIYGDSGNSYQVPVDKTASEPEGYTHTWSYELVDGTNAPVAPGTDAQYVVAADGTVTIKRAGKKNEVFRIKVTRTSKFIPEGDKTEDLPDVSAYLELSVAKKELTLQADPVENAFKGTKTYDNTAELTVNGAAETLKNVTLEGVYPGDEVSIGAVSGTAADESGAPLTEAANGEQNAKLTVSGVALSGAAKDNYTVSLKDRTGQNVVLSGTLQINYRTITLRVGNAEQQYNQKDLPEADTLVTADAEFLSGDKADGVSASNIIVPKAVVDPHQYLGGKPISVGEHANYLVPENVTDNPWENPVSVSDGTAAQKAKNYRFVTGQKGTLNVTAEDLTDSLWNYIENKDNYHDGASENGRIWVQADGQLLLTLKDTSENAPYNCIVLTDAAGNEQKDESGNPKLLAGNGYAAGSKEGKYTLYFKLACMETEAGSLSNQSQNISVDYYVDVNAPKVEMKEGDQSGNNLLLNQTGVLRKLFFTVFGNTMKNISVAVTENAGNPDAAPAIYESGLSKWQYAAVQVTEDIADLQAFIDGGNISWTDATGTAGTVAVNVNQYSVLFVKVFDNAGNSKIYTSTGLILENTQPAVSMSLMLAEAGAAGEEGYFCGDVKTGITVEDNKNTDSGVKNVYLRVKNGNVDTQNDTAELKEAGAAAETVFANDVLSGSDVIALAMGTDDPSLELSELVHSFNARPVTIQNVPGAWEVDGYVQAIAEDYAGNFSELVSKKIIIDKTAPVISEPEYKSVMNSVDGKSYAKEAQTVTYTITEKYYNLEKIWLELSKTVKEDEAAGKTVPKISLKDILDLQGSGQKIAEGVTVSKEEAEGEIKISIETAEDAEYEIKVNCTDRAGNTAKEKTASYVVDKTAPKLTMEIRKAEGTKKTVSEDQETWYYDQGVEAAFTLTETNFSVGEEQPVLDLITENLDGKSEKKSVYELIQDAAWKSVVGEDGKTVYQLTVPLDPEGRYSFQTSYTDPAGHALETAPADMLHKRIVVDNSAPEMKIGTDKWTQFWQKLIETITFKLFSQDKITVSIEGSETIAELAYAGYYYTNEPKTREELESIFAEQGFTEFSKEAYTEKQIKTTLPVAKDGGDGDDKEIIYVYVKNAAGVSQIYSSDGLIVDNTDPEFSGDNAQELLTASGSGRAENNVYQSDVEFTVTVSDPITEQDAYSGIKKVTYVVEESYLSGEESGSYEVSKESEEQAVKEITPEEVPSGQGIQTQDLKITIPQVTGEPDERKAQRISVRVLAEDYAGNTKEQTYVIAEDSASPEISYTYVDEYDAESDQNPRNVQYYAKTRTAELKFTDYNFSENFVWITLRYETETGAEQKYENVTLAQLLADDETDDYFDIDGVDSAAAPEEHLYRISFTGGQDGAHYVIDSIDCTDLAGNKAETCKDTDARERGVEGFYVDNTKPVNGKITVTSSTREAVTAEKQSREDEGSHSVPWGKNAWDTDTLLGKSVQAWYFSKTAITISLTGSDPLSAVESISYYYSDGVSEGVLNADDLKDKNWVKARETKTDERISPLENENEIVVDVDENLQNAIYLRVMNKAGQISYYSTDGIIVENAEPEVKIANKESLQDQLFGIADGNDEGGSNVVIDVEARDDFEDGKAYSGLAKVWYRITESGNGTDLEVDEQELYENSAGETVRGGTEYTGTVTVDKAKFNSNAVSVTVYAVDMAGNRSKDTVSFAIDNTNPVIALAWDNNDVHNNIYFQADRTATITFTERNFHNANAEINVYYRGDSLDNRDVETLYQLDSTRTKLVSSVNSNDVLASVQWSYQPADNTGYTGANVNPALTDAQTSKAVIHFAKEGDYRIADDGISCTDDAGNTVSAVSVRDTDKAQKQFTLDKTDPVLTVTYDEPRDGSEHTGYYHQTRTAVLTFVEHNADINRLPSVTITARDVNGAPLEGGYNVGGWQLQDRSTNTWVCQIVYAGDANYEFRVNPYQDYAERSLQNVDSYAAGFAVDKSHPEGSIQISGVYGENNESYVNEDHSWTTDLYTAFFDFVTFNRFSKSGTTVRMQGQDSVTPVETPRYLVAQNEMSYSELNGIPNSQWSSGSEVNLDPNQQYVIYMKITNYAGLSTYFNSEGVVADNQMAGPVITVQNLNEAQNGIFNEDVQLGIHVEDPAVGTYSGLAKIWYTVSASGNVTADTVGTLFLNDVRVQGNKAWDGTVTIPAEKFNSNDVRVQVFATDLSGNEGQSEVLPLSIDVTIPTVQITWNSASPQNGSYYKDTRTATVTVTERNFNPDAVQLNITNTDGNAAVISGWSTESTAGVLDSTTNICTVSFPSDGDYTFNAGCTDLAGNVSSITETYQFTTDKTVPVVDVTYDKNKGNQYYNETRTATVTIREHNFDARQVRETIEAKLEGQNITAPRMTGFSSRGGNVHQATVTYQADGDYGFDIAYTDLAGNDAADYRKDSFTIDKVLPEIVISGVQNETAYKDLVQPVITCTDINYNKDAVSIQWQRACDLPLPSGETASSVNNGETFRYNDFSHTEDTDDIYTLTVKMTDLAGNEQQETVKFSVNRFGSVYELTGETTSWLNNEKNEDGSFVYRYINESKPIEVKEINVDTLPESHVMVSRDGTSRELSEGLDYTLTAGTDSEKANWVVQTYTISADNFEDEGNYAVTISSSDKAENEMSSEINQMRNDANLDQARLPIEFTVDKTAPTVVVTGVEDNGTYREASRTVSIDAKDNYVLKEVVVKVDGKETEDSPYTGEDLLEEGTNLPRVIEEIISGANDWQVVTVEATDAAGNQYEDGGNPYSCRILVTPNILIQYVNNKPLFFGSIGAVVLAAGGIIFFLIFKKRKKDEEEQPEESKESKEK